jgi:molybdopterin converting factor small subunit
MKKRTGMDEIQIEIRIYAPFAGGGREKKMLMILENGASVKSALVEMITRHPYLGEMIPSPDKRDEFSREVLLLIGEKIVGLDDRLSDQDILHVLPAIVSG